MPPVNTTKLRRAKATPWAVSRPMRKPYFMALLVSASIFSSHRSLRNFSTVRRISSRTDGRSSGPLTMLIIESRLGSRLKVKSPSSVCTFCSLTTSLR